METTDIERAGWQRVTGGGPKPNTNADEQLYTWIRFKTVAHPDLFKIERTDPRTGKRWSVYYVNGFEFESLQAVVGVL